MKPTSFLAPSFVVGWCCTLLFFACGINKTPHASFSEETCPIPPDYADLQNWAAHPDKVDLADGTPVKRLSDGQKDAQVDVFFLHPTTLFGKKAWNGDPESEKLNNRTENTTIRHQASIFNAAGRIYAPRYRQMVLGGFFDKHDYESNRKAFHTAYCDLSAAFSYYLKNENNGRPIIIAAHSQGSAHAIHLLKEYFDGQPLQNQLVAAYIPGWPVPADTFTTLKPCSNPEETGCFTSWCSYEWGTAPDNPAAYDRAVVTNPITWKLDTLPNLMENHRGTVMRQYDSIYSKVVEAKVAGDILWVKRPDIKGTWIIRNNNFHIADYNLFWLDVRENAVLRAESYLQKHSSPD